MKLVIVESGTDAVEAAAADADALASSLVAYTEVRSALARGRASHRFGLADVRAAAHALDGRWANIAKVDVDDAIVRRAGDLAVTHSLRALDALHVASALQIASGVEGMVFVSWDRRQRAGAAAERLPLFPEQL